MPVQSIDKASTDGASIIVTSNESDKNFTRHREHARQEADYDDDEHLTMYPNWWSKYRMMLREPLAEFLAVVILIIFGVGVNCQVVLSMNPGVAAFPHGDWTSLSFGWAVGVAVAVWVSGGISGGHINPAVTLTLAVFRGFPWKKVPIYMIAQLLGAIVGGALVYANYFHAIDIIEGGRHIRTLKTAGVFSTFASDYMTNVSAFFEEFLASAVLMIGVLALGDSSNLPSPPGLQPLVLFILILGIGTSIGMQTGYAINPARDLGPRLVTAMVGYGSEVFTFRNHYWIWCPIMAPFLGCLAGAAVYDALIFTGKESIVNRPSRAARRRAMHAPGSQRPNMPAGPGADNTA